MEVLDINGQPLGQATIARYRFGDGEVLAVVKDNEAIESNIGRDGVTTFNDANWKEEKAGLFYPLPIMTQRGYTGSK